MRAISILFRRELGAYFKSPVGFIVAALFLFVLGILFQSQALGRGARLSAEVLREFFRWGSMVTGVAAIILSIRLLAEERQQQTIVLLNTSPIRDHEIVLGKFLAGLTFLSGIVLSSLYMPLLILVRGKISFSQVFVGYIGLILIGAAVLAIGLFASSIAKHQLLAAAVGAVVAIVMVLLYPMSMVLDEPFKGVFAELDLWAIHFTGFMNGVFNLKDVIYYLAVTYFFLLLATKTTEAKRWV
jgi:ABC-2 type transport system permease protein